MADRTQREAIGAEKRHLQSSRDVEKYHRADAYDEIPRQASVVTKLKNPLASMSEKDVIRDENAFIDARELSEEREAFRKGALLVRVTQREHGLEPVSMLSEEEKG